MISSPISATGPVAKPGAPAPVCGDPAGPSLLSLGEELDVVVVRRNSAAQYLVACKGRMILADSATPLKAGDTLRVRVDQNHPQLVLRVVSDDAASRAILTENLRLFRANPAELPGNLARTETLLLQALIHPRLPPPLRQHIRAVLNLLQALRYSGGTGQDGSYLRGYPTDLGLLMESHLKKTLLAKGQRDSGNGRVPEGLKELLLHLPERMASVLTDASLPEELRQTLQETLSSAEKTVKAIETQQVANVMLQEVERACLLQIPLLFPDGMKPVDILIREEERTDPASDGRRSFSVELFFELDALGPVLVELHLRDRTLRCVSTCQETAAREFVSSHLAQLQEKLSAAGYRVERLACLLAEDLRSQRAARKGNSRLYSAESINLFA
ncbi:MAG: flagellar hook-length control protein FliK [Syntrophales bacterium]